MTISSLSATSSIGVGRASAPCDTSSVPTLNEWMLKLLALMLVGFGAKRLRWPR
jgi:hypothetical protein